MEGKTKEERDIEKPDYIVGDKVLMRFREGVEGEVTNIAETQQNSDWAVKYKYKVRYTTNKRINIFFQKTFTTEEWLSSDFLQKIIN